MFRKIIIKELAKLTEINSNRIHLEIPENEKFGDYSSNIAMQLFTQDKDSRSPLRLAEKIAERLKQDKELQEVVDIIEVAGPGFINFWLKKKVLIGNLIEIIDQKEDYGRVDLLKGKKYLLEHTSPNTIKTLHVGHVRNNTLGMAVHNVLEFCGAKVVLDAINNDRGIHVMKAVWAYMRYGADKTPEIEGEKPDHFVDKYYVIGAKEAEDPQVKEEMQELLRKWEEGDVQIREVWKKLRNWTLEGFNKTYERLGSYHDHQWFESEFYERGKEMVEVGLKKGIFKKLNNGAVLSDLEKFGLSDTIVLRSDGTSMYHTQDLYLTKLKREKFPSDLYFWDIGPEQELYLRQLFAMCEQIGIGKRDDYLHLSYGFVYLKGKGKMSSRAGNVVSADDLLDEIVDKAREIIESSETGRGFSDKEKEEISEDVGLGAIKYGFLKLGRTSDLQFDINESLSLEGNSGPYLQYTFARTQSVLHKIKTKKSKLKTSTKNSKTDMLSDLSYGFDISNLRFELNDEEIKLLRTFTRFLEVISMSAKNYSPNLLCNYLYDLAQKYNSFYNTHGILEERTKDTEKSGFRLALTSATGQILKNGLNLLGIQTPEKM